MGAQDRKLTALREIVPEMPGAMPAGAAAVELLGRVRDVLYPRATQRALIVAFVVAQGEARSNAIAAHVGLHVSSIGGHLRGLVGQGLLEHRRRGLYGPGPKAPAASPALPVPAVPDGARFTTGVLPAAVTLGQLEAAFAELAGRTGSGAYFPALAEFVFAWIGGAWHAGADGRYYCPNDHRGWAAALPLDRVLEPAGGWSCPGILLDGTDCGYRIGPG